MPTITQLEYLVAVEQEGHFGKAAELCHVSQPSLSTQIQKVEEELGVVIFDRSMKPILTTEVGKEVLAQAHNVLREHKKVFDIANQGVLEPKGDFHLGVIPTLSPYVIPLFIEEFSESFPKVNLKINEFKTEDIVKHLLNDKLDAGLLVTPLGNDRLIERHLFFEPFYAYVAPSHPLANRKLISESDLSSENLWLLEEGHCFRDQVLKICSLERKRSILDNVEFAGGNLETLKNIIKRGTGYTLLPELAAAELNEEEKNTYLKKFKKPVPTREVSLIYSRSFLKESIIESLEKIIIENLPKSVRSLKRQDIDVIDVM